MECFNIRLKPTPVVINYNFKYFFKKEGAHEGENVQGL